MLELETQNIHETDSSDNEEQYSKLLSSVSQLDSSQRVKPASRKEASSEISEYNLSGSSAINRNLVDVKDLAKVLGKKPTHALLAKNLKKITVNSKTLPKPLEKPVEESIKRAVGFENVKKQLRRWDAIVTRNSLKDYISFPLNNNSMKMQNTSKFLEQFKSSPLETQIAKILKQDTKKEDEEEKTTFPLTLNEMMEKRKEMAQLRAKLSYKAAKAQRQSKIKSKKYHRILRHQKVKEQLKEFELLQKTDPDAALKKLAELDKGRAQERASLRHRNTGQWAKNLAVRAKYDVESRKVLAEQLKMSREITEKIHMSNSDEETADELEQTKNNPPENFKLTMSKDNPWSLDISQEVADFVSDYKKFWTEKNKEMAVNHITENKNDLTQSKINYVNEETNAENMEKTDSVSQTANNEIIKVKTKLKKTAKKRSSSSDSISAKNNLIKNKKEKLSVNICPVSGVWIVSSISEEPILNNNIENNTKAENIDDLFNNLDEELLKKAQKKYKKIKSKIKSEEKFIKKKTQTKNSSKNLKMDLSFKNSSGIKRPDMDFELNEGINDDVVVNSNITSSNMLDKKENEETPMIDPKKFIQVKPKMLYSHLPENVTGGDDALDNEETQRLNIEEAFIDDDVIAEFKEMEKEEKKNKQVEISTSLPGWGEWGGSGIAPTNIKRKKKRLIVNLPPRKDKKKKDVIINENENTKIKNHLVKEVPHPFKSVEAFEANIRAPVGRDWIPETAHRKLIQKQVDTQMGAVIDPMDESEIVKLKETPKSVYQGKQKVKKKSESK